MSFIPLKRILTQSIRQAGLEAPVSAARIVDEAQAAIVRLWGPERAAYVRVASFTEGTMNVVLTSPSAAHAFRMIETQWINEINRALGERKVMKALVRREGF